MSSWPTVGHDNGNTSDDNTESDLSASTINQLHPVAHVPDRRAQDGPLIEDHGRLFGTCRPAAGPDRVRVCAWKRSNWHLLWSVKVIGSDSGEYSLVASTHRLIGHFPGGAYVGLRQRDGHALYSVEDRHPEVVTGAPAPVVHGDRFDYLDNAGALVERSVTTGRQLSRTSLSHLAGTPHNRRLVAESAGYVVGDGRIYLYDGSDGDIEALPVACTTPACPVEWATSTPRYASQLAYSRGTVFSDGDPVNGTAVIAFSAQTGEQLFTLSQGSSQDSQEFQNYIVAHNLLIAADELGRVEAWPSRGCGQPVCLPDFDVTPTQGLALGETVIEAGGVLYTPGSYVYKLSTVRRSPYAAPGSASDIQASFDTTTCTVNLTWTTPTNTGQLPLTSSQVTASDGQTSNGAGSTATIGQLPAGSYTFTVAEQTAWGTGPASAPSTTITTSTCR